MSVTPARDTMAGASPDTGAAAVAIDCKIENLYYGDFLAVRDSHVPVETNKITGFIGPSGCGKSTVLRSLNRMNDLIRIFRFEGHVLFNGQDIYANNIDPVAVRRNIGMVFQQPNPFSMSIYENVAFGLRLNRYKGNMTQSVERALTRAGLWNEVKDKLRNNGLSPFRRAATASLYRPGYSHRAESSADGRAMLRTRSHRYQDHRAVDARAQREIHHRHRHSQHATGNTCGGPNGLLLRGHIQGRPHWVLGRIW